MDSLHFKVGQEAEAKSFTLGFRAAWFRCKIKNISQQRGQIGYFLEFYDFPDEKVTWTKLYQKPPQHSKSHGESKLELMVRPSFPPYFRESKRPDSYPAADVVAIVEDDWEVGDLVDWWSDGCFWSGRVTQLLGNDKVQIELPEPPIGEGNSYEAFSKDLRPSLNWSAEHGWTVPISREHGRSQYCARLVEPHKQDEDEETDEETFWNSTAEGNDIPTQSKLKGITEEKYNSEPSGSHNEREDSSVVPRDNSEPLGSHNEREDSSVVPRKISSASRYRSLNFREKVQSRESKYWTSKRHSDTVDSAIMELEELANKIRWLKGLLRFGFQWSNAVKPSWKILENRGPHMQR